MDQSSCMIVSASAGSLRSGREVRERRMPARASLMRIPPRARWGGSSPARLWA